MYYNTVVEAYIKDNLKYILDLAVDIARIPSMSGKEGKKAVFIKNKLIEICGDKVWIDKAGNVLYMYNGSEENKVSVYTAHIDTVFKDIENIEPFFEENRIYAPSIYDNSINVAALIFCIKLFNDLKFPLRNNILFAFDVGEEGYGNLKGIRNIVEERKDIIKEVIALDLGYKQIANAAVGSRSYKITIKTDGGHSWNDFGKENAIAKAASVINGLYGLDGPKEPKTTYNVGVIRGGTSVNSIAQSCEFDVNLRSVDERALEELDIKFAGILAQVSGDNTIIKKDLIGERPCGMLKPDSELIKRLIETRNELGLDTVFRTASTDANIPLSIGIPAVSFGVCTGGRIHTTDEYIETDSLELGMKHLIYFMIRSSR